MGKERKDWSEILVRAYSAVVDEDVDSWPALARHLDIPRSTLADGFPRRFGITTFDELIRKAHEARGEDQTGTIKVNVREDGPNKLVITGECKRILSPDQLVEHCRIDLDVWRVDHSLINKWEVGAKSKQVDLEWDDEGKAHGTVFSDGQLVVEPLFQVKVWLVRRELVKLFPTIQPISCKSYLRKRPARPPQDEGIRRAVLLSDAQIGYRRDIRNGLLQPFHDRRALDLALQIIAAAKPDRVDVLGDWLDFTLWNDKFAREPEFYFSTQPALCEGHWWIGRIRRLVPGAKITLHQGNHEKRVEAAIIAHLEEAYHLKAVDELRLPPAMSVQRLLALHEIDVEWIDGYPDDEDWLNERVYLRHGDKARVVGSTAKAAVSNTDCVEFSGHVHRFETVIRRVHTRDGDKVALVCCVPCLCLRDGEVPGGGRHQDWSSGIVIVDYERDGSGYSFSHIPFEDDMAWWDGRCFKGEDRRSEIAAAYPDWNWGGED